MLYMVVERFNDLLAVGMRFQERGRMMPEGLTYHGSWMDSDGRVCFQIMEAPSRALLDQWMSNWADIVQFEVLEIMASGEFWDNRRSRSPNQRGFISGSISHDGQGKSLYDVKRNIAQALSEALLDLT